MIPEIDIWRVATLVLKRYGDEAIMESAKRAENWLFALLVLRALANAARR